MVMWRADTSGGGSVVWEWQEGGSWIVYDGKTQALLEDAVSKELSQITYLVHAKKYVIDLKRWTQTNTHTGFTRAIRRVPPLGPGPAAAPKASSPMDLCTSAAPAANATTAPAANASVKAGCAGEAGDLSQYWSQVEHQEEGEDCVICLEDLTDESENGPAVQLSNCSHVLHQTCAAEALGSMSMCPVCKAVYGLVMGTMPPGKMSSTRNKHSLPGYPDSGTIVMHFSIKSGVQTAEHPSPGKRFSGTSRTAYLPDNAEGQRVAKMLERAWDQRLLFTVGDSLTTGQQNTVVFNGIHIKTSPHGGPTAHGYPDAEYLGRVTEELGSKGILPPTED
eukprot:TRINITY_DN4925_c0_g1_i5.p1 TRINITY_DN4925_c0_g1~~TRINITY_DN4925_c0_g1_i5.p1  ORF type:complete len:335 (+),score=58.45 TRINITY_DN4925_c0_g1_i5:68-1072(+)